MFEIKADKEKNRLHIKLGVRDPGDENRALEILYREMGRLRKGFTVLADLSEFQPVRQEEAEIIAQVQKAMVEGGVAYGVRVVASRVVQMQVERRARAAGFPSRTVFTMEEAEFWLNAHEERTREAGD